MSLEFLADPNVWLTLVTLSALEIVLGIDNLVFISIAELSSSTLSTSRQLPIISARSTPVCPSHSASGAITSSR